MIVAGIGGFVLIFRQTPPNPSRVGVALDLEGRPVLMAVQCPGHSIGQASIKRADGSDVVWSTDGTTGLGVNEIALSGHVPGYRVTGDVTAHPEVLLEVDDVRNERNQGVGDAQIEFHLSDLRTDQVVVGLDGPSQTLIYDSREEFGKPPSGC